MANTNDSRRKRTQNAGPARAVILLASLLVVVALLCGCASTGGPESKPSDGEQQAPGTTGKLGHPALGSVEAPVVLTEYSDYQ